MDDHLGPSIGDEHDDFQKVPSAVRSNDEPSIRVLSEIVDQQRVVDRVQHVVVPNVVAVGRLVDLHTRLVYYENGSSGRIATAQSVL